MSTIFPLASLFPRTFSTVVSRWTTPLQHVVVAAAHRVQFSSLARRRELDSFVGQSMAMMKRPQSSSVTPAADGSGATRPTDPAAAPVVVVEKMSNIHVMSIGINRPHKRNCVNEKTASALYKAFEDFENDKEMRCAVLHGLGGNFCAGYDLEFLTTIGDDLPNKLAEMLDRGPMGPTRMEFSKPVIAAVSGWAVAGGLELALMCDMRVVEESARLGVLCRRFGVPLIDGGTVRLPTLIGLSRAMDIILTGRIVEAKEAFDIGLANRLVATGTAYGQAINLAREIVKFPQECLRVDRASAYYSTYASKSLENSLQYEIENALHVINKESINGAKKFVEGLGKHGKFNVNPAVLEKQEWEKEFEKMEDAAAKGKTDK